MFGDNVKSQREVENTIREWGLLNTDENLKFYRRLIFMGMMDKVRVFGNKAVKIVMDIHDNFAIFKLKSEEDIRDMISDKDDETKILIADTYLRIKKGQEKIGLRPQP